VQDSRYRELNRWFQRSNRSFSNQDGQNRRSKRGRRCNQSRFPPVEIVVKAKMATSKGGHFLN
jgi:hypothetical protein